MQTFTIGGLTFQVDVTGDAEVAIKIAPGITRRKSAHQVQIESMMEKIPGQGVPDKLTLLSPKGRLLRGRLILEEVVETVMDGLGLLFTTKDDGSLDLGIDSTKDMDLVKLVDGIADISVVTIGTLSACGIPDLPVFELVDTNNLAKFGPGHSIRSDGKLIKSPDHKPPDFAALLKELGYGKETSSGVEEAPVQEGEPQGQKDGQERG